jgi:hypothetical protein
VKDVQIACPIEQQWLNIEQFTSVDAFDAHPIFHEAPTAVSKHTGLPLLIRCVPRVRQWDMWDGIQYCNLMLCDLQISIEDEAKLVGGLRMEIVAAKEIIRDWMCRSPF